MREYDVRKTQYTVADFLTWQRDGSLNLKPAFQRRSVWKQDAKSYFLDTVLKGLPAPIIYLRQSVELRTQETMREVVDGQQRLRTLFAYVSPAVLPDFEPSRDKFEIKKIHNASLGGKTFKQLPKRVQKRLLSYEFSTHVLPIDIEDREVLEMFARLNATGVKLNHQELRNAEYFGEFKSVAYSLALEQLDRWREWQVFTDDQITRMKEVEFTSDAIMNMIQGLTGKSQAKLDTFFESHDRTFSGKTEVVRRFRSVMDEIDAALGREISSTVYSSEVYFFTLFCVVYHAMFGLGSNLKRMAAKKLPSGFHTKALSTAELFKKQRVPKKVLDAIQRASADLGRRRTRFDYLWSRCVG